MKKIFGVLGALAALAAAPMHAGTVTDLATTQSANNDDRGYLVKVGQVAPDFEMKLTNGKTMKLSDLKGKVVCCSLQLAGAVFVAKKCHLSRKIFGTNTKAIPTSLYLELIETSRLKPLKSLLKLQV